MSVGLLPHMRQGYTAVDRGGRGEKERGEDEKKLKTPFPLRKHSGNIATSNSSLHPKPLPLPPSPPCSNTNQKIPRAEIRRKQNPPPKKNCARNQDGSFSVSGLGPGFGKGGASGGFIGKTRI